MPNRPAAVQRQRQRRGDKQYGKQQQGIIAKRRQPAQQAGLLEDGVVQSWQP